MPSDDHDDPLRVWFANDIDPYPLGDADIFLAELKAEMLAADRNLAEIRAKLKRVRDQKAEIQRKLQS